MGANIAIKWFGGEVADRKLAGLLENKLGSFFVGGHQRYGFVFAGGSVDLHFFELPAAGSSCKHICDTLQALPCELYLGIHASEGHNCVCTRLSVSSIFRCELGVSFERLDLCTLL